ncbi:MAG: Hsp20/alpha crystallin family protein, partial [Trinickia sp.]
MSNVTRYDPFSLEPMADLFQGFFRPMRGLTLEGETPL